jgi:Polyketide cyclase / dehydrase and lipid transport
MCTYTADARVSGSPAEVLDLLTEPEAIARWAPVPFEVLDLDGDRLLAGSRARVRGRLAGRGVEFDVEVAEAAEERLELVADGPISIDVLYLVQPAGGGSAVHASVSVHGRGLLGGVLAKATEALLAAGALHTSVNRLCRELELVAA